VSDILYADFTSWHPQQVAADLAGILRYREVESEQGKQRIAEVHASSLNRLSRLQQPFSSALCQANKKLATRLDWPVSRSAMTSRRARTSKAATKMDGRNYLSPSFPFKSKMVIYRGLQLLLGTKVALCRLD
jgi:hypothetical protein